MEFDYFNYLILPLLICLARVIDVSIGTIRLIFTAKGFKFSSPILGFFETLIWLIAVKQILTNVTHPVLYVAYAGGFALGTYVGIILEDKLSVGKVLIRIITQKDATKLIKNLKEKNYRLTISDAKGKVGKVKIIFSFINRKEIKKIVEIIKKSNPNAFYSIEDVRYAKDNLILDDNCPRRFLRKFK